MTDPLLIPLGILMLMASYGLAIRIGMRIQDGRITLMNLAFHIIAMTWLMGLSVFIIRQM